MTSESDPPEGWVRSLLGDAVQLVKDKTDPAIVSADTPYVGLEHVEAHTMRLLGHGKATDAKSTKSVFRAGDVLYGKLRPYLNKVAVPDFDGICSTDFLVFGESPKIDSRYLAYYLNQLWVADQAHQLSNGVELPRVNWKALGQLPIDYPPSRADQREIAARIERAAELRFSVEEHLTSGRHAVEHFREAVLAAAVGGRISSDWRSAAVGVSREAELPTGWTRATVEELAEPGAIVSYGIVKPGPEVPGGIPYVRQQDIVDGTVLVDQLAHTSTEIASKHRRTALQEGDVLLCIIRNLRVAIVPPGIDGAHITQGMVRIRPGSRVLREYLAYYLSAPSTQQRMRDQYVGLAMPRINVRDARELLVDLPPPAEQHEIVNRVNQLLRLADKLEERIDSASQCVGWSIQAILAKAFRGDLIASPA